MEPFPSGTIVTFAEQRASILARLPRAYITELEVFVAGVPRSFYTNITSLERVLRLREEADPRKPGGYHIVIDFGTGLAYKATLISGEPTDLVLCCTLVERYNLIDLPAHIEL